MIERCREIDEFKTKRLRLRDRIDKTVAPLSNATQNDPESTPKGKRGRKQETDPKEDKRIYDGWKASGFRTFAEYATKHGLKVRQVKLAVDRHEKQLAKPKEK